MIEKGEPYKLDIKYRLKALINKYYKKYFGLIYFSVFLAGLFIFLISIDFTNGVFNENRLNTAFIMMFVVIMGIVGFEKTIYALTITFISFTVFVVTAKYSIDYWTSSLMKSLITKDILFSMLTIVAMFSFLLTLVHILKSIYSILSQVFNVIIPKEKRDKILKITIPAISSILAFILSCIGLISGLAAVYNLLVK